MTLSAVTNDLIARSPARCGRGLELYERIARGFNRRKATVANEAIEPSSPRKETVGHANLGLLSVAT
jgi:hypothetical protein